MTVPGLAGAAATVRASVTVGSPAGVPLRPDVERLLTRVVVDTHLHLPDTFELTFLDEEGRVAADAGLRIGVAVEVYGGAPDSQQARKLIAGEVTSIEAICADLHIYTVVRGYSTAHRLQRARRTRTFVNMTDSDVARKVADDAGLEIGTVDDTATAHDHLAQVAQTDWEFLKQRAREVGYETGVADGTFFFRRPPGMPAGGGALGAVASAAASLAGAGPTTLTFKDNLITFLPRVTAANLTPEVEVRLWDPKAAAAVTATAPVRTGSAEIPGQDPARLAGSFGGFSLPIGVPLPAVPGLPSLGPEPSATAFVLADRPLAAGATAGGAAAEVAKGVAEHIGSTFAEAEGYAIGSPDVQAGARVEITAVPAAFAGTWTVTNARHVFDETEGGYHTRFFVSGRHERSLLGLASLGATQGGPTRIPGLVCGVVTNNNDPDHHGRVKVALPWLSPRYESDWARVAQFGAGQHSGALFTPEVGDEVLIGFELGDPRRPYVLGGLINDNTAYDLGGSAVKSTGMAGTVVRRGFVSGSGNRLLFEDELIPPPGTGPPMASKFSLATGDGAMGLTVDQTGGSLTISCEPKPPASRTPTGTVEITVGAGGTITIRAGTGGTVKIDGGANLELTAAASIKIESQGVVSISGKQIKLN
ncbi:phage baseplate assembly protein V [Planosporangium sp. 12N6]|uniref:phage baseplate assembly protein V n=1 Tax=Planosporangium spinosum TaxID=3402278 RepID=UPI003CED79F5